MLSLYEILKVSKTGIAPNMWTALAGKNWGGAGSGAEVKELTGIPPLSFTADGTSLLDYIISGNMEQSGTPTPTTPIQPSECGDLIKIKISEPLCGIGIYKDELNLATGACTRYVKRRIFDGTENWEIRQEGTNNAFFMLQTGNSVINHQIKASHYSQVTIGTTNTNTGVDVTAQGHIRFRPINVSSTSVSDFKSWLSAQYATDTPVTVWYVLTEPTTETVTVPSGLSGTEEGYLIQDGTPTPTNPIYPTTNGVKQQDGTYSVYESYKIPISSGGENLFDWNLLVDGKGIFLDGSVVDDPNRTTTVNAIPVTANSYTLNYTSSEVKFISATYNNGVLINRVIHDSVPDIIDTTGANELRVTLFKTGVQVKKSDISNIMLNLGSEPLPYEPYNRTTTPIYLGEVATTRRIKKLVLTGEETFSASSLDGKTRIGFNGLVDEIDASTFPSTLCSHYKYKYTSIIYPDIGCFQFSGSKSMWFGVEFETTVNDFKSYLAAQYAAGTPVTVWYVLATPETGTVNEPLRKIGDYADTLSMEQAGVQIPTNRGNTVIDVDTTLKPSEVYIKYKG